MKIIKHGNLKPRKFVCWHCDCEFVAKVNEYSTTTCNGVALCHYADCPECGSEACNSEPWDDKDD
jgi:hypothetical protein